MYVIWHLERQNNSRKNKLKYNSGYDIIRRNIEHPQEKKSFFVS